MSFDLRLIVTLDIPQLTQIGALLMESLQSIRDAVTAQGEAIVTELEQLASQPVIDPAAVQALADQIRANTAQIQGMVPDAPPEEPPA